MVYEGIYSVIELIFQRTIHCTINAKKLEEKLNNYQDFFTKREVVPIKSYITPRELSSLRKEKSFNKLRSSEALQIVREKITNTIPEGVSIFVTSRLTDRLIKDQRFNIADIFRYIGGRDLKHIGFVVKNEGGLFISHVDPANNGIKKVEDPLIFVHSLILGFDLSSTLSDLPEQDRAKIQEDFNETLLAEASKPRKNIPSMGPWVVLPFFLGHKHLWGFSNIELKEGQREMCSSFVAKILLKSFKAANVPTPIPSNEILERIHIVRFFHFFAEYLKEIPFPDQIVDAFPSPTLHIRRFLKIPRPR
jgi:hypothetical protein